MITVIGGAGFIGTRFCTNLKRHGVSFEVLDLRTSKSFPGETKLVDIRDIEGLRNSVSGTQIVNLAAAHRDDIHDKDEYYTTNVDGTRNICTVAKEKGIQSIVFTSTVAVYGFAPPETDETGEINPFNDYGKSKYQAEEVLRGWLAEYPGQRSLSVIRPTVVFGEGNRGNVYNLFQQIESGKFVMVGPGTNKKSIAYVGNLVDFLEFCTGASAGYHLFNYINEPNLDMNELVFIIREQLRKKQGIIRLPYSMGLGLGYISDVVARITGRRLPISSIRVKKFCATTTFSSRFAERKRYPDAIPLREAIKGTVDEEFINRESDREVFYTE